MAPAPVDRLLQALHVWEAEYDEMRGQLRISEIYLLWIATFRISRRLMADYQEQFRRGGSDGTRRAYTGKTRRLK
jgi:hypothetical protein